MSEQEAYSEAMLDALKESNPWWRGGFFDIALKHRPFYAEIEKYLDKRQIIGIYGLRRVGKSFLLYHLIKKLLKSEKPSNILYFSFDNFEKLSLPRLLNLHEKLHNSKPKYLFFDEIQKLQKWEGQLKRLYDLNHCKIFITGSESLFLRKSSKESLAGRIYEFELKPLSFAEYLSFRGEKTPPSFLEAQAPLEHYLLTAGFPELAGEKDAFFMQKYIKEGIIDKTIYREIPRRFSVDDPSVLETILKIIIGNPGLLIEKNSFARDLGLFRTTVSKYLFYLESSFLIKSISNYSRNASTSQKKLKKYYPAFSPLALASNSSYEYFSKAVETAAVLKTGAKFFWRSPQKDEVDIVLSEPLLPIEVKYRSRPDAHGIAKFQKKFGAKKGVVITKETEMKKEGVEFIPFWKWLLK